MMSVIGTVKRCCILIGILGLGLAAAAAAPNKPGEPSAEATAAGQAVQQGLDQVLDKINQSAQTTQSDIAIANKIFNDNKRYFPQMTKPHQAAYSLLQGWLGYFEGDYEAAYNGAVKACKLEATSGDAWISQAAFAMLVDKKPLLPAPPKPTRQPRNRNGAGTPDMMMDPAMQEPSQLFQMGKLQFDIKSIAIPLLGKTIEAGEFACTNGSTLRYQPGGESLCLLLWRKNADAAAAARPAESPDMMMDPMMMEMGYSAGQDTSGYAAALKKFYLDSWSSGKMKFLTVNFDKPSDQRQAIEETLARPWPWATAFVSAAPKAVAGQKGIAPDKPLLVLTDKTGAIKYAGPATGFIAPMVFGKIMDIKPGAPAIAAVDPNAPAAPADSNSLPAPKKKPAVKPAVPQTESAQPAAPAKELAEEDAIQAEKLTVYTEDLFMQMGKKSFMTYKRGVELCRQIMRDYPNTEYSERAKLLLRQMPDSEKTKYNVTDEEIGI